MFQNVGTSSVVNHQDGTEDNGFIQTEVINTQNLTSYEHIYISMWAVNRVSLLPHLYNGNCIHTEKKSYYLFPLYHTRYFRHYSFLRVYLISTKLWLLSFVASRVDNSVDSDWLS